MIRALILPTLALLGILSAVRVVLAGSDPVIPAPAVAEPVQSPFAETIAGAGIVEAESENIAIGTPVTGIVEAVAVRPGEEVQQGDILFVIDRRALSSAREAAKAAVALAKAEGETAAVTKADAETQWRRADKLVQSRVISSDEADKLRFASARAAANHEAAQAKVAAAEAELVRVETELERSVVRAPIAGTILKVNVRPGEYASFSADGGDPLILLGNVKELHVRVDIDENDAWRVRAGCNGLAVVRGNKDLQSPLTFVRFEPYVLPKRSLTGASSERTDTRVLQVIFRLQDKNLPVFVGQQVDVFVDGQKST